MIKSLIITWENNGEVKYQFKIKQNKKLTVYITLSWSVVYSARTFFLHMRCKSMWGRLILLWLQSIWKQVFLQLGKI